MASKFFNQFFQNNSIGRNLPSNKRVALCQPINGGRGNAITAISGSYFQPNVSAETLKAFEEMLNKHGVKKLTMHDPINCAEAHLWLTLTDLRILARNLDVYVAKKQIGKPRAKKDSPCPNCQQWARLEFRSLNQI